MLYSNKLIARGVGGSLLTLGMAVFCVSNSSKSTILERSFNYFFAGFLNESIAIINGKLTYISGPAFHKAQFRTHDARRCEIVQTCEQTTFSWSYFLWGEQMDMRLVRPSRTPFVHNIVCMIDMFLSCLLVYCFYILHTLHLHYYSAK